MILLDSIKDMRKNKYYFAYWNFSLGTHDCYESHNHIVIINLVTDITIDYDCSVLICNQIDFRGNWSKYVGEVRNWNLDYSYNVNLFVYELTDSEVLNHVLMEAI